MNEDQTRQSLNVAAIQMVSGSDIQENMTQAESLIRDAVSEHGAELVVLPENFLCFSAKRYFDLADEIERYINHFSLLAKELQTHLVLGSIPISTRPDGSIIEGKLRTASIHVDPEGEMSSRYDKMHLFDVDVADGHGAYRESNEFEPGETLAVTSVNSFKVGLSICYDLRFPSLYQQLRSKGAEILVVPAAFTAVTGQAHWETLLRARAIETQCYVVAANQGGQHTQSRATWGHSMIIDPWGEVLSKIEAGAGFCVAELNRESLNKIRRQMPVINHSRF